MKKKMPVRKLGHWAIDKIKKQIFRCLPNLQETLIEVPLDMSQNKGEVKKVHFFV